MLAGQDPPPIPLAVPPITNLDWPPSVLSLHTRPPSRILPDPPFEGAPQDARPWTHLTATLLPLVPLTLALLELHLPLACRPDAGFGALSRPVDVVVNPSRATLLPLHVRRRKRRGHWHITVVHACGAISVAVASARHDSLIAPHSQGGKVLLVTISMHASALQRAAGSRRHAATDRGYRRTRSRLRSCKGYKSTSCCFHTPRGSAPSRRGTSSPSPTGRRFGSPGNLFLISTKFTSS